MIRVTCRTRGAHRKERRALGRIAAALVMALGLAATSAGPAAAIGDLPNLYFNVTCWWQAGDTPILHEDQPLVVALEAKNEASVTYTPDVNELLWSDAADEFQQTLPPPTTFPAKESQEMVVTIVPADGSELADFDRVTWRVGNRDPGEESRTVAHIRDQGKCPEEPLPTQGSALAVVVITMLIPLVGAVLFVLFWRSRRRVTT